MTTPEVAEDLATSFAANVDERVAGHSDMPVKATGFANDVLMPPTRLAWRWTNRADGPVTLSWLSLWLGGRCIARKRTYALPTAPGRQVTVGVPTPNPPGLVDIREWEIVS